MQQIIYIIEDDKNIAEIIKVALESNSYTVFIFETSESAILSLEKNPPLLIISDIMLPGLDGISSVKLIRDKLKYTPIILLTAKGEEEAKVLGLNSGADDYVTKPFSIMELIARVNMHVRKSKMFIQDFSNIPNKYIIKLNSDILKIDLTSREVTVNDSLICLTFKEFELLKYIIENKNKAISREEILNKVWGYNFTGETRTVDIHIKFIRQKILPPFGSKIKTIRGFGYKFIDE